MAKGDSMFVRAAEEIDLIDRHIEMLKVTKELQPIGIIRLSEVLGIPKHKVRYSLRLLEQDGLIIATNEGAMVSDCYDEFIEGLPEMFEDLIEHINKVKQNRSRRE